MEIKVVTDIVTEPVSLAVMKNYLKWDDTVTAEDTLITNMIKAAREKLETLSNKAFAEKTIQVFFGNGDLDRLNRVKLPYSPHVSITSVHSVDAEGTQTALTLNTGYFKRGLDEYEIEFPAITGTIGLITTNLDFKVIYVAGYGASGEETIPQVFVEAIQRLVAYWYEEREAYSTMNVPADVWYMIGDKVKNVWI